MLLDGYWKKEIISLKRQLALWSIYKGSLFRKLAEHKVNRCFLFSAAIIRKIVEDEEETKRDYKKNSYTCGLPQLRILNKTITVTKYKFIGDCRLLMVSSISLGEYDFKNGEKEIKTIKEVCNQLIHSYVWCLPHNKHNDTLYGVFFASDKDKEKLVYLITIADWISIMDYVSKNCSIS